jgi:hypothetical protein
VDVGHPRGRLHTAKNVTDNERGPHPPGIRGQGGPPRSGHSQSVPSAGPSCLAAWRSLHLRSPRGEPYRGTQRRARRWVSLCALSELAIPLVTDSPHGLIIRQCTLSAPHFHARERAEAHDVPYARRESVICTMRTTAARASTGCTPSFPGIHASTCRCITEAHPRIRSKEELPTLASCSPAIAERCSRQRLAARMECSTRTTD